MQEQDVKIFMEHLRQSYLSGLFYDPWKQAFVTQFIENYNQRQGTLYQINNQEKNPFLCRLLVEETYRQMKEYDGSTSVFGTIYSIDSLCVELDRQLQHLKCFGKLHGWLRRKEAANQETDREFEQSIVNPPPQPQASILQQ